MQNYNIFLKQKNRAAVFLMQPFVIFLAYLRKLLLFILKKTADMMQLKPVFFRSQKKKSIFFFF
jgi:hypothetical protein